MELDTDFEESKNRLKIEYLRQEALVKKELMQYEFELNSQIEGMKSDTASRMETVREDRRDARVDQQAAHQKEMIDQRTEGKSLKNFESSGNDILTGGANMGRFGL
jgi:hypothetical protein